MMRRWRTLTCLLFVMGCSRELPQSAPKDRDVPTGTADDVAAEAHVDPADSGVTPDAGAADAGGSTSVMAGAGGAGQAGGVAAAGAAAASGGAAGQPAAGSGAPPEPEGHGIQSSDEVFRDDVLRTYELTFADEDWAELQRTAAQEIYVPVTLSVDGEAIGKVGVRYKGAFGTLEGCFEDGEQTCRKLSMKVKFDEYDRNLRFHGLKKLNFHSSLRDGSHLRERVGYKLFREFGVLAPRSVHARVVINGEYKGLYNLTEDVDGRFTDYRFEGADGQGTLYKEAWPAFSQDPAYYTAAQQTNEGSATTKIVQFAQALASASHSQLGAVVTEWMAPEATLHYLAVHTAIKHWDGPLTFYCEDADSCINHNYFFYESATRSQLALVAWDLDNIFYEEPITDQAQLPRWYESPEDHEGDCDTRWHADETGDVFIAPACDRLVQGFVQLGLDNFRDTLDVLLQGPFQVEPLHADIDRWAAQIDESVETDPAGSGYEDWRGNVDYLKRMVEKRYEAMQEVRDGM